MPEWSISCTLILGVISSILSKYHNFHPRPAEYRFNEMQDTRHNLERLLRKTIEGLCVHVAAKMDSHTLLRILLRQHFAY